MHSLIERFQHLQREWPHAARGGVRRGASRNATVLATSAFIEAHRELYQLAQAICAATEPHVQEALDAARRQVMKELQEQAHAAIAAKMSPTAKDRPLRWVEYQITPEVHIDPSLLGRHVSRRSAKALAAAHRRQVKSVIKVVGQR